MTGHRNWIAVSAWQRKGGFMNGGRSKRDREPEVEYIDHAHALELAHEIMEEDREMLDRLARDD